MNGDSPPTPGPETAGPETPGNPLPPTSTIAELLSEPSTPAEVQQAAERAESAATRRRWITLAELVGVVGLVIAALGLWMNWSDRRDDAQSKQAERATENRVRSLVMFKAVVTRGGHRLMLSDSAHDVQGIDVQFPSQLGVAKQKNVDPQIDSAWFAKPLLTLTDGGADEMHGRLPVLITAHYWDADAERRDMAIYDVVWKTEGRILQGRTLLLESLKLRERNASHARLDALWEMEKTKVAK